MKTATPTNSTHTILMVRPKNFFPNDETAQDNHYQTPGNKDENMVIAYHAEQQFDHLVKLLRAMGVDVTVVQGKGHKDEVFPNNWFSTEANPHMVTFYPMRHPSRRKERRPEMVRALSSLYNQTWDISPMEEKGEILEGTGALLLDRVNRVLYAALSERCTEKLLNNFADKMNYSLVSFHAHDKDGRPIYHTNVVGWVGTRVAALCLEAITDPKKREEVQKSFIENKKTLLNLTQDQIGNMAGNALEVKNANGDVILVMSERAYKAYSNTQMNFLKSQYSAILKVPFDAIEMAGGSVRCTIAELFGVQHYQIVDAFHKELSGLVEFTALPEKLSSPSISQGHREKEGAKAELARL